MPKTGGEYLAQAEKEARTLRPIASLGSLVMSLFANLNPLNVFRDAARKASRRE